MGGAWEGICPTNWEPGPPTEEPGPANQNECFPTKGLNYRQNTQFHQLSGWLVSDDPSGE